MEIGQEKAEVLAILNLLSHCQTSLGVGSNVKGHAVVWVIDYQGMQQNKRSRNRLRCGGDIVSPKSALCRLLFVCPKLFVFLRTFVMGTKGNKYGSVCNAKQRVLRQKTARQPFKQHCTRGNSRLSLPVASSQSKLFAT